MDGRGMSVRYAEMRDNRIWRNAIKRGKVQQNMLKMGYIPPNYKK